MGKARKMKASRPDVPREELQSDSCRRPGRGSLYDLIVISGRGLERSPGVLEAVVAVPGRGRRAVASVRRAAVRDASGDFGVSSAEPVRLLPVVVGRQVADAGLLQVPLRSGCSDVSGLGAGARTGRHALAEVGARHLRDSLSLRPHGAAAGGVRLGSQLGGAGGGGAGRGVGLGGALSFGEDLPAQRPESEAGGVPDAATNWRWRRCGPSEAGFRGRFAGWPTGGSSPARWSDRRGRGRWAS